MQRIKFSIKHLSNFAHKKLILVNKMSKMNIIVYRGFNIETTNFHKLTSIEVIGNYTNRYEDAEKYENNKHLAEKLTADVLESEDGFNMRVNLQDENWIHLSVFKKTLSSIDECIELMKKCIDRYLFRE